MAKTFEDIEVWFYKQKLPYFSLHDERGRRLDRTPDALMKIVDEGDRLEKVFEHLHDAVFGNEEEGTEGLADGTYTVKLQHNMNAGKHAIQEKFDLGEVQPKRTERTRQNNSVGIAGLGSIGGLEFIAGMLDRGRGDADTLRDQLWEAKLELRDKKHEIEKLKEKVAIGSTDSSNSWDDVFKDVFRENASELIGRIFPEKGVEVGVIKDSRPIPTTAKTAKKRAATDDTADDGNDTASDAPKISVQEANARLKVVAQRTETLFPNNSFLITWETVLDMAENSPLSKMIVSAVNSELKKKLKKDETDAV